MGIEPLINIYDRQGTVVTAELSSPWMSPSLCMPVELGYVRMSFSRRFLSGWTRNDNALATTSSHKPARELIEKVAAIATQ